MSVQIPIILERARLDVREKTRSHIFTWRGQFTPQLIEYLLNTYAESSDLVLDPFCGSGTVLLEAARKNIDSIGYEINPAACAMANFMAFCSSSISERLEYFDLVKACIDRLTGMYHDLLIRALSDAQGEVKEDIVEALSSIDNIKASPLFEVKEKN